MPAGAPQGLAAPMQDPNAPPAALGGLAMAQLAPEQQSVLDAVKAQLAQQALSAAVSAMQGLPNPAAEAAVTEPAPMLGGSGGAPAQPGELQGGGY